MALQELLKKREMSMYQLSKISCVPYTTINDICSGKAKIEKCSAETIWKIAKSLNITMESLLADKMETRIHFELFKSNVCHDVKENLDFYLKEVATPTKKSSKLNR